MARWLDSHPDVFITKPKELYFFSHDGNYSKGWSYYQQFYANAGHAVACGEATTDYCYVNAFPSAPERIARHVPDCRLIFMVRNPLDRIASQWELARSTGSTDLPLARAVFELPQLIETSRYLRTMQDYLLWFSRDQILIVFFEEFRSDPRYEAQRCLAHIRVDDTRLPITVSRAPNRSEALRKQTKLVRRVRKYWIAQLYRTTLPKRARNSLHKLVTRKKDWEVLWDDPSRDYVHSTLDHDTRCFLEKYTSKGMDHWSLQRRLEIDGKAI